MKRTVLVVALVLAVLPLAGCGGGGDSNPPPTANVAGDWFGLYTLLYQGDSTYYYIQVGLTISQTGNTISGGYLLEDGTPGTISGTVSGNDVSINYAGILCTDSGHVTGSISGNQMNFSGSGNTGNCPPANVNYSVWGALGR